MTSSKVTSSNKSKYCKVLIGKARISQRESSVMLAFDAKIAQGNEDNEGLLYTIFPSKTKPCVETRVIGDYNVPWEVESGKEAKEGRHYFCLGHVLERVLKRRNDGLSRLEEELNGHLSLSFEVSH
jgi:hypothetical protein